MFLLIWPYNAAVLLLAIIAYAAAPSGANLSIERKFDPVMSVRENNLVRLLITNHGRQPISFLLRDEAPESFLADKREFEVHLLPGQTTEIRYHVTPAKRGDFFFRGSFIRAKSFGGIVYRQTLIPTRQIVRVYPNVLALRKFDLLKQRGHLKQIGVRRSRLKGIGTDFESLRDYVPGDDYRKIEWKATSRRGKLIVKEFESERNQPVILVIDTGRLMMADVENTEKFDLVLDAALLLCNAAATANDQVGVLVYGDRVQRWISPKRGRTQVGLIIEALHALKAEPFEPDSLGAFSFLAAKWKRRGLIVVFTDLETPEAAKQILHVLGPLAKRHICLVVTVSDPEVRTASAMTITGERQMYEKTAAILYQEERVMAQLLLNQVGVRTLDAEPKELGSALVNYYLDVKATARL